MKQNVNIDVSKDPPIGSQPKPVVKITTGGPREEKTERDNRLWRGGDYWDTLQSLSKKLRSCW